jgi:two-component system, chemotaxis family, response regulator Rcp1
MTDFKAHVRILLVEDNPADVHLIRKALNRGSQPYQLEVASDGEQALNLLRQIQWDSSVWRPELVLLDLNLPVHDGPEILRYMRKGGTLSKIPVIVFSSSDSPKDRRTASDLGATRYVRKSSSLEEYLAIEQVMVETLAGGELLSRSASSGSAVAVAEVVD